MDSISNEQIFERVMRMGIEARNPKNTDLWGLAARQLKTPSRSYTVPDKQWAKDWVDETVNMVRYAFMRIDGTLEVVLATQERLPHIEIIGWRSPKMPEIRYKKDTA